MKKYSTRIMLLADTIMTATNVGMPTISNRSFELQQNFPNPFNPITEIQYTIPKDGIVKLIVYDLLGNEIGILENRYRNSRSYFVIFVGKNLASGIYSYRLEFDGNIITKKMLLIK